jgi:hypothetical protein
VESRIREMIEKREEKQKEGGEKSWRAETIWKKERKESVRMKEIEKVRKRKRKREREREKEKERKRERKRV